MKFIKIFDIILNIDNVNYIFTKNLNDKLIQLISEKYCNKCYMNSYIIKITKIINRSLLESNQNDLNCSFNISIQFEAECIIYNKNEIILDMEIQEKVNNNIIVKKDNILALIKNNSDLVDFKKGYKIPIVVGKVKYTLGSDKISINSYPFVPIFYDTIYYKLDTISKEELDLLNENIIQYIKLEEKNKEDILKNKSNTWDYFKNLVYPYNKISKMPDNSIDIIKCIENIDKYNNSIISLDDKYDLSNRKVGIHKENDINKYIKNNTYLVLFELCKKYYLYLKLINDLSITYNTKKLITDNQYIFDIYNKYKK